MNTNEWTFDELKEFVDTCISGENNIYEFKKSLNGTNSKELRKDFSSFANSNGGFIFVGVDNNRNIKGIPQDDELYTNINRCLSNSALSPKIRFELQNRIAIPRSNPPAYVYVFYIHPTLRHKKPHVSDCKVYVREHGESKPVSLGSQMRELFVLSTFNPEYIEQLEYDLKKIQKYEYSYGQIDYFYLKYLGKYLDDLKEEKGEKGEDSNEVDALIKIHKNICTLINETEQLRANERSSASAPSLDISDTIKRKYAELASQVDIFIFNFKKVHK